MLQNGNYSFLISRKNNVFNRLFRDSAFEHFAYFVRVEEITILVVAVISGLNPATHVRALCGDVFQTVTIDRAGGSEYENLRSIARLTAPYTRQTTLALGSLDAPLTFLELDEVFSPPLRESERFRQAFSEASRSLAADGSFGAVEQLLA